MIITIIPRIIARIKRNTPAEIPSKKQINAMMIN
jgi:hypothetical protein